MPQHSQYLTSLKRGSQAAIVMLNIPHIMCQLRPSQIDDTHHILVSFNAADSAYNRKISECIRI